MVSGLIDSEHSWPIQWFPIPVPAPELLQSGSHQLYEVSSFFYDRKIYMLYAFPKNFINCRFPKLRASCLVRKSVLPSTQYPQPRQLAPEIILDEMKEVIQIVCDRRNPLFLKVKQKVHRHKFSSYDMEIMCSQRQNTRDKTSLCLYSSVGLSQLRLGR